MEQSNQLELPTHKLDARTAIYARYSSDMQNPRSADDQIDRAKYQADRELLKLIKFSQQSFRLRFHDDWIIKDEAETGKVADRHGYDLIVQGIRQNRFDVVLVDDLSRLTRSLGDQLWLYDLLKFKGVELYSICDGISSESPNAKTFFQIKGMVNELGNDMHAQRTKRGLEVRVLKGFSSGDICYGFGSRPTQTRMSGGREIPSHFEIFIIPEEAKIINLIFDLKIKGLGGSAIARYLNEKGVPSTSRGQKITGRDVNWNQSLVRKILMREKYIGVWGWGKTSRVKNPDTGKMVRKDQPKNHWVEHNEGKEIREDLVIVSIEKWQRVQKMFAATAKAYKETKDKTAAMKEAKQVALSSGNLLAGILFCDECQSPFLQITGRKGGYYGCYMHHRKDPTRCSNKRLLNRKKIEAKVVALLKEILVNPEHLSMAAHRLNAIIKRKLSAAPQEMKQLDKKKTELAREIQNLLKFVMTHGDSSTTVKETLENKERESQYLDQRIRTLKTASVDKLLVTPFALKARFEKITDYFDKDSALANAALRKIIPEGLRCKPNSASDKKNHNQFNSVWAVTGRVLVANLDGFSDLGIGGPSRRCDEKLSRS